MHHVIRINQIFTLDTAGDVFLAKIYKQNDELILILKKHYKEGLVVTGASLEYLEDLIIEHESEKPINLRLYYECGPYIGLICGKHKSIQLKEPIDLSGASSLYEGEHVLAVDKDTREKFTDPPRSSRDVPVFVLVDDQIIKHTTKKEVLNQQGEWVPYTEQVAEFRPQEKMPLIETASLESESEFEEDSAILWIKIIGGCLLATGGIGLVIGTLGIAGIIAGSFAGTAAIATSISGAAVAGIGGGMLMGLHILGFFSNESNESYDDVEIVPSEETVGLSG